MFCLPVFIKTPFFSRAEKKSNKQIFFSLPLVLTVFSFPSFGDEISLSALNLPAPNISGEYSSETSGENSQNENKIDWTKPIVSRGFGLDESDAQVSQSVIAEYKSGQVFYFFGEYEKAVEKWRPLLQVNFAEAQASMGWLYQAGLGVKKDEKKAFNLYSKAAKQNNAIAQNNLGVMYENGIAVNADAMEAERWYKLSAEQGYRFGQYNYANSLLLIEETSDLLREKKRKQAKLFLRKSADQGVKQAVEKLKMLSES